MIANPSIFDSITKLVSSAVIYLGGFGGLALLLYGVLRNPLEQAIQKRFDLHFSKRLENIKHELRLEQQKMSVVYEHQKDSFRKVLVAMHDTLRAIERGIEGEGGDWNPISENSVGDLSRVLSQETLFMDSGSDHALRLFQQIMWTAVQYEDIRPSSDEVRRAYDEMRFISDRLAEHFRVRVGLELSTPDPLLDIDLLGACRLINTHQFADFDLPTKGPLKFQDDSTPSHVIAVARENPKLLKSELSRLKQAISSKHSSFHFETLIQIDRYLGKL